MNDVTRPPETKEAAPTQFPAMLKTWQAEIARALPKHMNPDRMARIALTAFRQSPFLGKCDQLTIFAAVVQSAQLGLEVGLMGEAHLVPFKTKDGWKCQLIPGYQGLIKLARNSGLVKDIYAHEVREKDEFQMVLGLERSLTHKPLTENGFPASDDARGKITGFYAVAVFKDGTISFVAMSRHEVERIRDNSKGYQASKRNNLPSPWDSEFTAMGVKTAIRRLCKFMPKSPELATALSLDDVAHRGGEQGLNLADAIEGTWAPATDEEDDEPATPAAPVLPALTDDAFAESLKKWLPSISSGKKTADQVIATAQSKYTLTDAQIAAIRGNPAGDPR